MKKRIKREASVTALRRTIVTFDPTTLEQLWFLFYVHVYVFIHLARVKIVERVGLPHPSFLSPDSKRLDR